MEHAIHILEQHLVRLTTHLGKAANQQELLAEIDRTVHSLQDLHSQQANMEAAMAALAAAQERLDSISAMGTVGGSKGHSIVAVVVAKRSQLRRVVTEGRGITSDLDGQIIRDMLSEIMSYVDLDPPPAASVSKPVLDVAEEVDHAADDDGHPERSRGEKIAGMIGVGQVVTGEKVVHHNPDALIRHGLEKHLASQSRHRTAR